MREIENALVVSVTVDRAHESVRDFELVVQHFCERRETIGGAARVGNDRVLSRIVNAVVDPDAKRRVRIFRRRADQHPLRSGLANVQFGFVACGEKAGRFPDNIDTEAFPRKISRVALLQNLNLVAAYNNIFLIVTDFTVELAVNRVPFQEVGQRFCIREVVNRLNARDLFLRHRPEDVPPDAPEAVDCVICHKDIFQFRLSTKVRWSARVRREK